MRSLRSRLLALWLMLVASGAAAGFLLFEFYWQSTDAQVRRAEDGVEQACRQLADRYRFFVSAWHGGAIDGELREELGVVAQLALTGIPGVEGGFWQADAGSLAYAFPTYEGTGPKTDVPAAELSTIQQVNQSALRNNRPATVRQVGRSQVLVVHACPLSGPLPKVTGWTMTRAFIADSLAYRQLVTGLTLLALIVFGSAIWLARVPARKPTNKR